MTTTSTNISFNFRDEFQDQLLNKENSSTFVGAFARFCNNHPDPAKTILWRLTYNVEFFEEELQKLGLNLEIVPLDKVSTLRDELRYQYNVLHPDFLAPQLPDSANKCAEAFTALKNHTDEIVANAVLDYCYNCLYVEEESKKKILRLLGKPEGNNSFGGLRQLGFTRRAASYLMPYHLQIRDLFKALCDCTLQNSPSFKNTPFEELDKQLNAAGIELPFEFPEGLGTPADEAHVKESALAANTQAEEPGQTEEPVQAAKPQAEEPAQTEEPQAEEPAQPCSEFKPLTPENILEHRDVFEFLCGGYYPIDTITEISKLGFDLNKVILKKDVIYKVLDVSLSIEEADKMLREAESLKEEAEREMAMVAKALAE